MPQFLSISLEFLISNINVVKAPLGLFPYRAYVS